MPSWRRTRRLDLVGGISQRGYYKRIRQRLDFVSMKNKTITEMLLNGIGTVAYMSGWIVWKLKKQIWFLTLIMIGMYLPLLVMQNVAFAPKAEAQLDNTQILKPTPYQQQVVDYIH